MEILAFLQSSKGPSWLTRNKLASRFGVMQIWSYSPTGDLETKVCLPVNDTVDVFGAENHWLWSPAPYSSSGALNILGFQDHYLIKLGDADLAGRKKAIHFAQERVKNGYQGDDRVQSCDFHRSIVFVEESSVLLESNCPNTEEIVKRKNIIELNKNFIYSIITD